MNVSKWWVDESFKEFAGGAQSDEVMVFSVFFQISIKSGFQVGVEIIDKLPSKLCVLY